ncbi:MAG: hypothetical protein AAF995_04675 [Planctomycetota bacterium]
MLKRARSPRMLVLLLLLCGAPTQWGCSAPAALTRGEIEADAGIREASRAVGFVMRDEAGAREGRGEGLGEEAEPIEPEIKGSSAVRLAPGVLVTAAHATPSALLYRGVEDAPVLIDGLATRVRLLASGIDDAPESDRRRFAAGERYIPAADDWALLARSGEGGAAGPLMLARARAGEAAWVIGFPSAYFEDGWSRGLRWPDDGPIDLQWRPPPAVVLPGTVRLTADGKLRVRIASPAGTRANGFSGGGIFVRRGQALALVGIASKSSKVAARLDGAPINGEALEAAIDRARALVE